MSRHIVLRSGRSDVSLRLPTRPLLLIVALTLLLFVAICITTAFGAYTVSPVNVARALVGSGNHLAVFVVRTIRLPRVLMGALVGATLALSGAIIQNLTRNPLASPDILGINEGAAVVVVWMIIHNSPVNEIPVGAFGGAVGVIVILALLGVRRRFSAWRLLLMGIAVNMALGIVVSFQLQSPGAQSAQVGQKIEEYLFGSVANASWYYVRIIGIGLLVLAPIAMILGRQLNMFQLGEDMAVSLGVRTSRMQIAFFGVAAMLSALAVTVAGPVGFVAFVAPHIARRISRTASAASLPVAMGVGAILVLLADYVGKRIIAPTELPLGLTTTLLGAPYFLYLLVKTDRDTGVG
jgi:iron complex transport system permease protein